MLKLNATVDESKQGIILTDTNVVTGMDGSSSLSDDDVAGNNCLSVSLLYAKALRLAITAVLSRTEISPTT